MQFHASIDYLGDVIINYMLFQPKHINNEALCVLKQSVLGHFAIGYEQLENPLKEQIESLERNLKDSNQDLTKLYEVILVDPVLKVLFSNYSNFCEILHYPYQRLNNEKQHILEILNSIYRSRADKLHIFQTRILALKLHHTYAKCRSDSSILAFSHRYVGWITTTHKLDSNFNVNLITNFGYGNSAYFFTRLSYKGIDIIPFTEWINYRFAEQTEVVFCSSKHSLDNESWYNAFDYIKTACNMFLRDEISFARTYIKGECQKLVQGLISIMRTNKFTFITSNYHFIKMTEEVTMVGDELIAFRGGKVSGSLFFIEHIRRFKQISDVQESIVSIERLNEKLHPILHDAGIRLANFISDKEIEIMPLHHEHKRVSKINDEYSAKRINLIKELNGKGIWSLSEIEKTFATLEPQYQSFKKKFDEIADKYYKMAASIDIAKQRKSSILNSVSTIENYFKDNNLSLF